MIDVTLLALLNGIFDVLSLLSARVRRYKTSNDLMVVNLIHLDFIERSQYLDVLIKHLILMNGRHSRGMMLLEAHNHVADKGAL